MKNGSAGSGSITIRPGIIGVLNGNRDGTEITITDLEKRDGKLKRYYRDDPQLVLNEYPGARIFKSENLTSGGFRKNQSLTFN